MDGRSCQKNKCVYSRLGTNSEASPVYLQPFRMLPASFGPFPGIGKGLLAGPSSSAAFLRTV